MRTVFKVILILFFFALAAYFLYWGNVTPNSYIFVYPADSENQNIKKDLLLLKKDSYKFIDLDKLKSFIKNPDEIGSKKIALFINKVPDDDMEGFLKRQKIPATFMISEDEAVKAAKFKGLSFGLRTTFPNPKPITPKNGYFTFNFDDNYAETYNNALPVLRKAGFSASFYVITRRTMNEFKDFTTPRQVQRLQDEGWEIGSHSFNHEHFLNLDASQALDSLTSSKGYLEGLGLFVAGFAYPFGQISTNSMLIAQNYYKYQRFVSDDYNYPGTKVIDSKSWHDELTIEWLKRRLDFAKKQKLGVGMTFHLVSNESTSYAITPSEFKKVVEAVKNSGLPVYSNIAIFGKPLYLRQESGGHLESNSEYINRMRLAIRNQRKVLEVAGIKINVLYYPEGVTTSSIIVAAKKEGFNMATSKAVGFLQGGLDPMNLKTVTVKEGTIQKLLN